METVHIYEGLFGFTVLRNGKDEKHFTKRSEAIKYIDYLRSKKRHVWGEPAGDYFNKRYECKDCGLKRSYTKKDGRHYNSYMMDGVHYDSVPPCKFKQNEIQ